MKKEPLESVPLALQTSYMINQEEDVDQAPIRHSHSVTLRKAAFHTAASPAGWCIALDGLSEY